MSLKKLAIALVILALVATGAYLAVTVLQKKPEVGLSTASLSAGEVLALDPLDRPDAGQRAGEASKQTIRFLNRYYLLAMLRPERWSSANAASGKATPPAKALEALFTTDAAAAVEANVKSLALADLGDTLDRVVPTQQFVPRISVQIEDDGSVPFIVATVEFRANGIPKDDSDGKRYISIVHEATYWLQAGVEGLRIFAYQARLTADELTASNAFGVPQRFRERSW